MVEWLTEIQKASQSAATAVATLVEQKNIAKELSDLIIYCAAVPFSDESKCTSFLKTLYLFHATLKLKLFADGFKYFFHFEIFKTSDDE